MSTNDVEGQKGIIGHLVYVIEINKSFKNRKIFTLKFVMME